MALPLEAPHLNLEVCFQRGFNSVCSYSLWSDRHELVTFLSFPRQLKSNVLQFTRILEYHDATGPLQFDLMPVAIS